MSATWLWLRRDWTARWRSSLMIALLVAVTGGTVLALAAGARRTATSLDRFDRSSLEGTFVDAQVTDPAPLRALAGHPMVEALGEVTFMAAFPQDGTYFPLIASVDGVAGRDVHRGLLVRGRRPDPSQAHEVALSESTAARLGAGLGSKLRFGSLSPEQWAAANQGNDDFPETLLGPPVELRVVGVVRTGIDLARRHDDPNPTLLTPAFFDAYHERMGVNRGLFLVRLDGGADSLPRFGRLLQKTYGDRTSPVVDWGPGAEGPRGAIRVVTTGLVVAAVTALAAGLCWVALALHRHASGAASDLPVLAALGFSPRDRFAVLFGTMLPALAVGMAAAGLAAVLASPLFPVGLARRADPDLGLHVDVVVLGPGIFALASVACGLAAFAASRSRRTALRRPPAVVSPMSGVVGRAAARLGPAATVGVSFALRPDRSERRIPLRSTVAGAVVGLVGVVTVGIVGASMGRLLDTPARYGATWDVAASFPDDVPPATIVADRDISAAAVGLFQRPVTLKDRSVIGYALQPVKGDLGPAIVAGRAPAGPDEVALGADTLERAGAEVGSSVALGTSERAPAKFRVVGQAVFPSPEDPLPVADGVLFAPAGLDRLGLATGMGESYGFRQLLIKWRPGVDHDLALARFRDRVEDLTVSRPGPEVARLAEVERFPQMLAAFLVVLSVVAVAHGLTATVRRRRHDFAVLAALGLTTVQRRGVVASQSAVLASLALVVGIPFGLVAGRWVWAAMSRDLGVATDAAVPPALLALASSGTLVLFGVLAAWTGRRAARVQPARVLRAE